LSTPHSVITIVSSLVWGGGGDERYQKIEKKLFASLRLPLFYFQRQQLTNKQRQQWKLLWRGHAARAEHMEGSCLFVQGCELNNERKKREEINIWPQVAAVSSSEITINQ
jgi:hypothetical protein